MICEIKVEERDNMDLSNLFETAQRRLDQADNTPRGQQKQNLIDEARVNLERATKLINELDLFSTNETIDDVATENLKYFLIPALLAKTTLSTDWGPNRIQTLQKAITYMRDFLERLKQYEIMDGGDLDSILSYTSKVQDNSFVSHPSMGQMAEDRKKKIEQYQKEKAQEERLRQLFESQKDDQVDDELKRNYYLALLQKFIANVQHDYRMAQDALEIERRGPQKETSRPHVPSTQSFTIKKSDLQKKVFGLGYPSPPVVTVDEFISKKISDGDLNYGPPAGNSLQKWAEQSDVVKMEDEEDEMKKERAQEVDDPIHLIRERNWDNFKDDNPRGSGNRKNMG